MKSKFTIQHYTYNKHRDERGRFGRTVTTVVGSLFSLDEDHIVILAGSTGELVKIPSRDLVSVK